MPKCSVCLENRLDTEFNIRSKKTGLRRKDCKICQKRRSKEHYERNKESFIKRAKKWRLNNPDKAKLCEGAWKARNKGKRNAEYAEWKASKIQATPKWADMEYIRDLYENCREAEQVFSLIGVKYHVDHIVPLRNSKMCGLHCEENMQILTMQENCSKNNRVYGDMYA